MENGLNKANKDETKQVSHSDLIYCHQGVRRQSFFFSSALPDHEREKQKETYADIERIYSFGPRQAMVDVALDRHQLESHESTCTCFLCIRPSILLLVYLGLHPAECSKLPSNDSPRSCSQFDALGRVKLEDREA